MAPPCSPQPFRNNRPPALLSVRDLVQLFEDVAYGRPVLTPVQQPHEPAPIPR